MRLNVLILSCLIIYGNSNAQLPAGTIDSTFGKNGIASTHPEGGGTSMTIQADGKILICGGTTQDYSLIRLNANGKLDSTFGINGISTIVLGIGYNFPSSICLQQDGKILVAGSCVNFQGVWCFGLVRFNSDGSVDNTFNGNGTVMTSFNSKTYVDYGHAVAVQSDGKIIEVGSAHDDNGIKYFASVRFNSDGSLDNSFGSSGKVLTTIGNSFPSANCIAIQSDGKILVGGTSYSSTLEPSSFALVRYNVNGTLDKTFGTKGRDTAYFGGAGSDIYTYERSEGQAIVIQADGKIIMTGSSYLIENNTSSISIIRYNTDGSIDSGFGKNGKVVTLNENYGLLSNSITTQEDGKILIAGSAFYASPMLTFDFMLARYNKNGNLDSTFGNHGFVITSIDSQECQAFSVVTQNNGKILLGGSSTLGFTAVSYLSGLNVGILNLTTSNAPPLIYPNPINATATLEYTLTQPQNISIKLYNLSGEVVQTFIVNQNQNAGEHKEVLNFNEQMVAGEYLLSISNGAHEQMVKVTIAK